MINPTEIKIDLGIVNAMNRGILAGAIVLVLVIVLPIFVPYIFDYAYGDKVETAHLQTLVGNESNATIRAQKLMSWIKDNTLAPYNYNMYVSFGGWAIVNISNKPHVFIRTDKASWFIVQKLGNCGEDAWYFAELMNKSGFRSRIIQVKGEDHEFAEFYDENGKKIVVDPSSNRFINDTLAHGDEVGKYWSYLEAQDLAGNTEDVTQEYLRNTSPLTINVTGTEFLEGRIRITIESLFLKNISQRYSQPIEVVSYNFDKNKTYAVRLGAKKEYQITDTLDLYLINFKEVEQLDLSQNRSVEITPKMLLKPENMEINSLGVIYSILGLSVFILANKVSQKYFKSKVRL